MICDNMLCLSDPRDRVLIGATPVLPMPRFGTLEPPHDGQHRFLVGCDGLYMQARSKGIDATVLVCPSPFPLPYGEVTAAVIFRAGMPPSDLFALAQRQARQSAPNEWAGVVVHGEQGQYKLLEPETFRVSPSTVQYLARVFDTNSVVLDLHSHGDGDAYFSPTDDASDLDGGIFVAAVIGRCRSARPDWKARLVVNGHFFPMAWSPDLSQPSR